MKTQFLVAAGAAAFAFAGSAGAQITTARPATGVRLATPPIVRPNVVQTVTRDGNSAGRATFRVQRGIIGGQPQEERRRLAWDAPGPDYYGASEYDARRVWVQIGGTLTTVSPWIDQTIRTGADGGLNDKLNGARQQWLRQRGYIGAVRGVRNPISEPRDVRVSIADDLGPLDLLVLPVDEQKKGEIVPRATIHVPAEVTKFRKEMMVRLSDTPAGGEAIARFSMPPQAGPIDGLIAQDVHEGSIRLVAAPVSTPVDAEATEDRSGSGEDDAMTIAEAEEAAGMVASAN